MKNKRRMMMQYNKPQTSSPPLRTNNTIPIKTTSNSNRKVSSSVRPKLSFQMYCREIVVCSLQTTTILATSLKCNSSTMNLPHLLSNTITRTLNSTKKVQINKRSNRKVKMLLLLIIMSNNNNLSLKRRSLLKEQSRRMKLSD
jgi:hypothetical protein